MVDKVHQNYKMQRNFHTIKEIDSTYFTELIDHKNTKAQLKKRRRKRTEKCRYDILHMLLSDY